MKAKNNYLSSGFERFSYGLNFMGQNIFYVIVSMFLLVYFTDIGIPAATVALIALVVKIWDAVNDPIFGGLVDRIRFKSGKFLPWLRISLVLVPAATIFMFAVPSGLSMNVKIIWSAFGYILWDTAYTMCDAPIYGLITTISDRQAERNTIMSFGRTLALFGVLVGYVVVPLVRQSIGGWLPTVIVLSLIAFITMAPLCFVGKERVMPPRSEKEISVKDMFHFMTSNKYMLIFFGGMIIFSSTAIYSALGMYLARYNLGNESIQSLLGILSILPGVIMGAFIPIFCRKVDKFQLFFWSLIMSAVMGTIAYFVGYQNFTLFMIFSLLKSIPSGMIIVLMFMFTPDCVEYGTYKTGINASGVAFTIQTFTAKLVGAITTALAAAALAVIGFVETEGAVQAPGFADKLWFLYTMVPVFGLLLSLPVYRKYKLRDADVEIMAKANRKEITRDEAEKLLGGRY